MFFINKKQKKITVYTNERVQTNLTIDFVLLYISSEELR